MSKINFDPEKENGATVFVINQTIAHYQATGECVRRMLNPNLTALYQAVQALHALGEITEAQAVPVLTSLRAIDSELPNLDKSLTAILDQLKEKHHVEQDDDVINDDKLWDTLKPQ